eukprot:7711067-Pyramimonas_sp.AAC.1
MPADQTWQQGCSAAASLVCHPQNAQPLESDTAVHSPHRPPTPHANQSPLAFPAFVPCVGVVFRNLGLPLC